MLSLRAHAIICASLFGALLVIGWGGNILQATGVLPADPGRLKIPLIVLMLGLTAAFAFSAIPVMVKLVLGFQRQIGNESVPVVRSVLKAETTIIWVIWGLMAAGLAIAVPAAIVSGAFDSVGGSARDAIAAMPTKGTLEVRPGMLLADMVKQSTLPVDPQNQTTWTGSVEGGTLFDFHVAGTGITFPRCRYYFVSTFTDNPARIEAIDVGTSPSTVSRADLEAADGALRTKLAADGWLTGHEEYRDEQDRSLHGGATRGPEGRQWLKDGIVLDIESKRMDDEAPGEDAATAGQWIQFVELWQKDDYPGIDRLVFAAPQP